MDFVRLFTSFSGRISRAKWWLGFVIFMLLSISGTFLLTPGIMQIGPDSAMPEQTLGLTIWGLVFLVPLAAITVKRFNDRDRPFWLGFAIVAVYAAQNIAGYLGYQLDPTRMGGGQWALHGFFILVGLAALIDNGFLRGTPGANRYGENPLGTQSAAGEPPKGGDWAG